MKKPKQQRPVTIKVTAEVAAMVDQLLAWIRQEGIASLDVFWREHLRDQPLTKGAIVRAGVLSMHAQIGGESQPVKPTKDRR